MVCPKCNNYTSWRYKKCPFCGILLPELGKALPPPTEPIPLKREDSK